MTRSILVILFVAVFVIYSCEAQNQHCVGGKHDRFTRCGSQCEPSCSRIHTGPCIRSCAVNVCRCQNGFYRRESDQQCVTINECPSHQHPPPPSYPGPPPYGRPPYGRPPFGRPPYGRPPFGRPPYRPHDIPPYRPQPRPDNFALRN